jgi:hypothetical protein
MTAERRGAFGLRTAVRSPDQCWSRSHLAKFEFNLNRARAHVHRTVFGCTTPHRGTRRAGRHRRIQAAIGMGSTDADTHGPARAGRPGHFLCKARSAARPRDALGSGSLRRGDWDGIGNAHPGRCRIPVRQRRDSRVPPRAVPGTPQRWGAVAGWDHPAEPQRPGGPRSQPNSGGERIRTSVGPKARNGFRDRRIRPLCHPSAGQASRGSEGARGAVRTLRSPTGRGVRAA